MEELTQIWNSLRCVTVVYNYFFYLLYGGSILFQFWTMCDYYPPDRLPMMDTFTDFVV